MDFARYLVELDIEAEVTKSGLETRTMPADFTFTVHSANPVGAENIEALLDRYVRWKKEDPDGCA
jgi:hypothetical protein